MKSVLSEHSLFNFLKDKKMPVIETILIRHFFPDESANFIRELNLSVVQTHFILYHYLHRLSRKLIPSNYLLYINSIYIYLLKKPDSLYCSYFDEDTISFCMKNKELEDHYCQFHLHQQNHLASKKWLKHPGIDNYYLDFTNYQALATEYPSITNRAKKIQEYALSSIDLEESYQTLGAQFGDPFEVIQKKFKNLARKYHPDVNPGAHSYHQFQVISQSYYQLKDFLLNDKF